MIVPAMPIRPHRDREQGVARPFVEVLKALAAGARPARFPFPGGSCLPAPPPRRNGGSAQAGFALAPVAERRESSGIGRFPESPDRVRLSVAERVSFERALRGIGAGRRGSSISPMRDRRGVVRLRIFGAGEAPRIPEHRRFSAHADRCVFSAKPMSRHSTTAATMSACSSCTMRPGPRSKRLRPVALRSSGSPTAG
jgi:hypothetical protein